MTVIASAASPNWADIMTAFGTVGAVVAAVGIAIWGEWRTNKRIEGERARSDKILADERALADDRLAGSLSTVMLS